MESNEIDEVGYYIKILCQKTKNRLSKCWRENRGGAIQIYLEISFFMKL